MKKGTGARALRSLIEKLMLDLMYEIPSRDDVAAIKITAAVVLGEAKPLLRRKNEKAAA
jgi:ATP-dependent Clp protease ATP-binding subunit ClpX